MPLGIDVAQILLHLFNVVLLFAGLYYLLYRPITDFMHKRQEHYTQMDEEAKSALAEAEESKAAYAEKLKAMEDEIAQKRKSLEEELAARRLADEEENKRRAEKLLEDARADAERQKAAILESARDDILHVIKETTEKVVLEGADEDVFESFLEEAERSAADAKP